MSRKEAIIRKRELLVSIKARKPKVKAEREVKIVEKVEVKKSEKKQKKSKKEEKKPE